MLLSTGAARAHFFWTVIGRVHSSAVNWVLGGRFGGVPLFWPLLVQSLGGFFSAGAGPWFLFPGFSGFGGVGRFSALPLLRG